MKYKRITRYSSPEVKEALPEKIDSGNSFKGTMVMSMPQANMNITTHMNGKRIGDCK